jgi:hypothetical protein
VTTSHECVLGILDFLLEACDAVHYFSNLIFDRLSAGKHSKSSNKFLNDKAASKKKKREIKAEKSAQQIFLEKKKLVDLRKEC